MKKLLGLLVAALTLSAFMTGCSKPSEGDTSTTTPSTTTPKDTTAPKDTTTPSTTTPPASTTPPAGAPSTPPATTGK